MNRDALSSPHYLTELPILVLMPHNRCNCRCTMCDIWRLRDQQEVSPAAIQAQIQSLRDLKVKWIVFSGGEPQLHSDLAAVARPIRNCGIRLTLLTAGLLLASRAREVADLFDDVIVSLDGPAAVHDSVRRVPNAFARLANGITRVREARPDMRIAARCTVQKLNQVHLRDAVRTAKELQLDSISFLAVDLTSTAFNRLLPWSAEQRSFVGLNGDEVENLAAEVELLIEEFASDIASGFIAESAEKLRRLVRSFRSALGQTDSVAPRCNAPWVSAVVESDGKVRPCFFHAPIGNLQDGPLPQILNSERALAFRRTLDVGTNPVCRNCVCSLYVRP